MVKLRTNEQLNEDNQHKFRDDLYTIGEKYIGKERTDKSMELYHRNCEKQCKKDAGCTTPGAKGIAVTNKVFMNDPIVLLSTITCPVCGHTKEETMSTDTCLFFYECEDCHILLKPKEGDCCVFCSYGSVKCPPVQQGACC